MLKKITSESVPNDLSKTDLLVDRKILVTGAGTGIGKELALSCAKQGGSVILLDSNEKLLEQAYDQVDKVSSNKAKPLMIPFDLTEISEPFANEIFDAVRKEYGALDALVNNAAILGELRMLKQYPVDLWQKVMKVNLEAPFVLSKACLPLLSESDDANLIFTSSSVATLPQAYWGAYAVSKGGIESLAEVWAAELEQSNVKVKVVNPGPVRTKLRMEAFPAEDPNTVRLASELMPAYTFLLSKESRDMSAIILDLTS